MPYELNVNPLGSIRHMLEDVLTQTRKKPWKKPAYHCNGAVLLHLVGAWLECTLGDKITLKHKSYNGGAIRQTAEVCDFLVNGTAIHVTRAPSERLLTDCAANIEDGLVPMIMTDRQDHCLTAAGLAKNIGFDNHIDSFEVGQFIASSLLIRTLSGENPARILQCFVHKYNQLIEEYEADTNLCICLVKSRKSL